MNITCDGDSEEYEGQLDLDEFGAYYGCNCIYCRNIRNKKVKDETTDTN